MPKFFIRINGGEMAPRFYGVAWRDFPCDVIVLAPMPLNLIIRLSREVYYWCLQGGYKGLTRSELQAALSDRREYY